MKTIQQKAKNVCLQINELYINNWYLIGRTLQSIRTSPIIEVTILFSVKLSNVLCIHRSSYENSLYLCQKIYLKSTISLTDRPIRSGCTILYFCQCWIKVLNHNDCCDKNILVDGPPNTLMMTILLIIIFCRSHRSVYLHCYMVWTCLNSIVPFIWYIDLIS